MRFYIFSLVFCLLSHVGLAQVNLKATQFIDQLIAAKNADQSSFIRQIFDKGIEASDTVVKKRFFYQDSVGKYAVKNMREGLKRYTHVFHGIRDDSVTYIDSTGKRSVLAKNDASDLAFKSVDPDGRIRVKIELIADDSLVITENERSYLLSEIDKMQGHVWAKNQFLNLRFIAADTVKKVFAHTKGNDWGM